MNKDNKINATIRVPIGAKDGVLTHEAALSLAMQFKDQPITMEESVVGLCRSATVDINTGDIIVDAVIWATIGGLSEKSALSSFEVVKN